mmetsp:Transcript_85884/g.270684  ORF Transcript_85884/g.270684 Transcript_85884/m.270684 type:complete len:429 (+) Transcript_85884:53-1339(+)
MQPSVPRGFQPPGNAGMLDFGRFGGPPPQAVAGQGRPLGFPQGGFLEDAGYPGALEEDWSGRKGAAQGAQPPGAYGPYMGAQPQGGFTGGFPASKPPTFPPPQPPAGMAGSPVEFGFQNDDFPALGAMGRQDSSAVSVGGPLAVPNPGQKPGEQKASPSSAPVTTAGRAPHLAQPELPRAMHTQPPPPPSQAPHVPPSQPPAPQGPPPLAPPLMSPPAQPSQSSRSGELSEEDRKKEEMLYLTTPEAERAAREKYGLLGILKVIRMTDPDLNTLALGMDLTTLGLNLNSPECLYTTFASPWSDTPARKDPKFYLPTCYYQNPPQLKTAHLQKFKLETLFYIFFNMPRDTLQACAAAELYNRGWKFHREQKAWFVLKEEEGQHRWVRFDPNTWETHYYLQPVDNSYFLAEDDVRVKMPPSGGMQPTPTA